MLFNSPLSSEKANQILRVLDLPQGGRILDAGCGEGELLIRAVSWRNAQGLGVDIDPEVIETARRNAAARLMDSVCEFRVANMQEVELGERSFDVAMCVGSSHAFGIGDTAYPNALDSLRRLVRPGGRILMGEGYWKQPPAEEYVELIGEPVGVYRDHAGNIGFAEERGWTPLYAAVSNTDEWDHFEWSHKLRIESLAAGSPGDPAIADRLHRSREWRNGYLKWGRDTMGFGFYIFQTL